MDLTVMLPAYNEEKGIGKVIDEIRALPIEYKILVGDNMSSDETCGVVENRGITPVLVYKKGKGNVIRTLLKYVDTPYVCMVNSDYTYALDQLPEAAALLKFYDIVLGWRKYKMKGSMSLTNRIGNGLLTGLANLLYGARIHDLCSGLQCFRTDVLRRFNLTSWGYTLEADLFINAVKSGCVAIEVPIKYRPRLEGGRGIGIVTGLKIGWFLIRGRFSC